MREFDWEEIIRLHGQHTEALLVIAGVKGVGVWTDENEKHRGLRVYTSTSVSLDQVRAILGDIPFIVVPSGGLRHFKGATSEVRTYRAQKATVDEIMADNEEYFQAFAEELGSEAAEQAKEEYRKEIEAELASAPDEGEKEIAVVMTHIE